MPEVSASKYYVQAGWDDAPHLDAKTKAEMLRDTPPHLKKARSTGEPSLGSGAIYPVDQEEWFVDPFPLPDFWPRAYALDVGWKRTAALWGAWDRDSDTVYLYSEHYRGQAEPSVHADAIKMRGAWIPGVIDPAARGRNQKDGTRLIEQYRGLGLELTTADNSVEAGIYEVWQRISSGRLKAFKTLVNLSAEHKLYRRDEDGKIVKSFDHLMDDMRYLIMSGLRVARTRPIPRISTGSMVADSVAGY
ncbi:hypothetical protein [Sphingomonas sp.]|uniref:phage terminase large subunit family protein n=1 Tax=Sphingomonas sp. TaxID=28214 RepID=UPI00307F0C4C